MEKPPLPEKKIKKTQLEKDAEWLENWRVKNTPGYIRMADRREFTQEDTSSFRVLVDKFKTNHSLENLNAITFLRPEPEDAEMHKMRMDAKNDLNEILNFLNNLENKTKISQLQYTELYNEYQILSRAIGILNRGKINHTRG